MTIFLQKRDYWETSKKGVSLGVKLNKMGGDLTFFFPQVFAAIYINFSKFDDFARIV